MITIRQTIKKYIKLSSGSKPPGRGWHTFNGSKKGAMRREKEGGGYEYWYPSQSHADKAHKIHNMRAKESREDAEASDGEERDENISDAEHHEHMAEMSKSYKHKDSAPEGTY